MKEERTKKWKYGNREGVTRIIHFVSEMFGPPRELRFHSSLYFYKVHLTKGIINHYSLSLSYKTLTRWLLTSDFLVELLLGSFLNWFIGKDSDLLCISYDDKCQYIFKSELKCN